MEIDNLIEFLLQYQGKGMKITELKQWNKYGDRNSIILDNDTKLVIHENPYDEKEISMWINLSEK
jgi:hypothetical protein